MFIFRTLGFHNHFLLLIKFSKKQKYLEHRKADEYCFEVHRKKITSIQMDTGYFGARDGT